MALRSWTYKNDTFDDAGDWANFVEGLFNDLLGSFYEQTDPVDDIDRIYRQQEAQAFMGILDDIASGTADWRDLASFEVDYLSDVDGFTEFVSESISAAQYQGLYSDLANASTNEDFQRIFNEYANAGIETNPYIQNDLASTGSATAVLTGTIDNSILEQIIRDAALGDGILGGEVDFEDLPGYGGIWEGLIRHIKVIGKGLPLPIPDWLPLPGIFELPTIGEIFDTVTGPWKEAAQDALRNCMDPDGDGVDDKPASQCLEEQSVIDILVDGIGNATSDIYDATAEKVQGILDETIDCASNPSGCAQEVFDKLKDIFGDGAVDPTSTGGNIPDWVKVIIIGGAYGDEILGELEDLFGGDIDDDGTIGVTDPNTFDCSSIEKSGGMVPDASYCGDCSDANQNDFGNGCEPVCQYNNAIPASSSECVEPFNDTGPTQQDCDALGRTHIPGDAATQTPSACGGCKDDTNTAPSDENDPMSECVGIDDPNAQEGDPCNTGAPLNAEGTIGPLGDCIPNEDADCTVEGTGEAGKIENGECAATPTTGDGGCPDGSDPEYAFGDLNENGYFQQSGQWYQYDPCNPNASPVPVTQCADGSYQENAEDCPAAPVEQCQDPNRDTNTDGSCADTCKDGSTAPETGLCPEAPSGEECAKLDGTPTGATPESGCEQCPQGFTFDFNGICQPDSGFNCDDYNKTTNEDGTCGPCKEGYEIDTSLPNEPCVKTFDGCSPGFELVNGQCTAIVCPEGQSYCIDTDGCVDIGTCPSDTPEEEEDGGDAGGGGGGGAGGGGGGRSMFQPYSFNISADPQLLSRSEFPITDFLAGIFTNSRGGRNV
jgi:hypothetical protein